ncbi:4Fe-4S dicluster domain-containing protein [Limnochorda pilosa]|uniref:4Fe-4S ferredoxin n=1 Tax=Limnochorda pilosa TaxID=1555112 RepID=A0A0K2SHC9_LIMPI|nr:4Fe-4S dicluster domain-containing protein [Limnochorda pilosa]BAS26442.1 4Fe-4S ferredoxin [Limnochorda pilosa]
MILPEVGSFSVIDPGGLDALIRALRAGGYAAVGPTVHDRAVVYAPIEGVRDLPAGWTDRQEKGTYRLEPTGGGAFFAYTAGALPWKAYLTPPRVRLWQAERNGHLRFRVDQAEPPRLALIGVRACELAAMEMQDATLLQGPYPDPVYRARREQAFILAVACTRAGGTCFCASTGTGPAIRSGFDLALTEQTTPYHRFVVQVGSQEGRRILAAANPRPARESEVRRAAGAVEEAARSMGRRLEAGTLRKALGASVEGPIWEEVASRCLGCGNCTMVCPVCGCHTATESTNLEGTRSERRRRWDSCFSLAFGYIHGGPVRASGASRYRQWLFHKLGGEPVPGQATSGCVGCGRCITWCPAAVDLTEVASVLLAAWAPFTAPSPSEAPAAVQKER